MFHCQQDLLSTGHSFFVVFHDLYVYDIAKSTKCFLGMATFDGKVSVTCHLTRRMPAGVSIRKQLLCTNPRDML